MTREEAGRGNEYFSVDENGIHFKEGTPSGANGGASSVVIDDRTSHITICGGAGEQVRSIVKALRGLADALATLTEQEGERMTREQAIEVLINRYNSGVIRGRIDDDEWRLATETAIAALREIDAMYATDNIGESMVKTLKQACPYCSWIDPERLEEDEVDGPQNYCRVCGRDLRR